MASNINPALSVPRPDPVKRAASPIKLGMGESHKLMNWLLAQTFSPTDTYIKLASRAAEELGISKINEFHISGRMRELELKIPATKLIPDTNVAIGILARAIEDLYNKLYSGHGQVMPVEFAELLESL